MIKSIEISNFKSIRSKRFPLRNLNVLLGLNGQGKSSFIQSLLLLRQSDKPDKSELKLQGGENGLVNIGTATDLMYQYNKEDSVSYEVQFDQAQPVNLTYAFKQDADVLKAVTPLSNEQIRLIQDEPLFSNKFQYLNAQRIEPKSSNIASYSNVMESNSLGKYGQYTAHYIELRGNDDVVFENLLHKDSSSFDEVTGKQIVTKTLLNQINLWLGEISPGVSVQTNKVSTDIILLEYDFEQPNVGRTNKYKPENVGFGISYALHVVTALLSVNPGGLVIIENPESHIHPSGQAELGKLIALVAQNDVQIIIETHSDHILNGIRVGVKEQKLDKDKAILFYFNKVVKEQEQYSEITNIELDRNGTLSELPQNLLSEWTTQMSKLIR
jgi:predicted ATPase